MKKFTDSAGREWAVSITIGAVKRLKGLLDVDLMNLQEGDPPLLARLGTDAILLCDTIFVLVKPQADKLGVSDVEFGESLGGDVILAAQTAFWEELQSFFQKLGRTDLARAVAAQARLIEKAVSLATARIESLNPEGMAEKAFEEEPSAPTSGEVSTSSPGPSV
jgi:hypothetical protein